MSRRRGGSSQRWRERQASDPFVERARREGWRARAVFKLEEIDRREHLFRRGLICVDLGAAPGSWSQYAARRIGPDGRIVAIDLLAMDPLPGVEFLQGDFTDPAMPAQLTAMLEGARAGLVMSDMAPNISGNRDIDQPRSIALVEEALWFAEEVLAPGGGFLVKLFQGSGMDDIRAAVAKRFGRVKLIKPRASRTASREIYLLATRFSM